MKLDEIKKIAAVHKICVGKMKKAELVRAIQKAEGNEPCFGTHRFAQCSQNECCWCEDCV